jgi:hypothetical protein
MERLQLLASPWWVNLLVLVPIGSYFGWRARALQLSRRQLVIAALFAMAFGLNEAAVVVYLRAALGLVADSATATRVIDQLPGSLTLIEVSREAATMVMLITVSTLTVTSSRERWALFLWLFAFWDISYYVGLWCMIRWPPSLLTQDVLFLIPTAWVAQVWFPVLVSLLAIGAVLLATKDSLSRTHPAEGPRR